MGGPGRPLRADAIKPVVIDGHAAVRWCALCAAAVVDGGYADRSPVREGTLGAHLPQSTTFRGHGRVAGSDEFAAQRAWEANQPAGVAGVRAAAGLVGLLRPGPPGQRCA